jgi:hypothetical protein
MVKMAHPFGKADPPKRVVYTVSDDWTSARRGNKKLRLCALGTALDRPRETIPSTFDRPRDTITSTFDRPRETIPSTFDQKVAAAIGSETNYVEAARRLRRPQDSMSTGAPRTSQNLDVTKRFDVLSDYQMQMLLLEQQNKKRLLMPRDSPTVQPGYNPFSRTSGKRDYSDYPPVPGEEYGNRGPTTASNTLMEDSRGQILKPPSPPPAFAQMSQQEQMDMFRQAQARNGLLPNPRSVSATTEDKKPEDLVIRPPEFELRRRQNNRLLHQEIQIRNTAKSTSHSPVYGPAPNEMPGRPSRVKRRTQGPPLQPYSRPLPSDATTKQDLVGIDINLERRRARFRTRVISDVHDYELA